MKFLNVFRKSMREQSRDVLVLVLTLIFAPLFVLLYTLFFPSGSTTYSVLVINHDVSVQLPDGSVLAGGDDLMTAMSGVTYADGSSILKIVEIEDRKEAEARLRDRDAAMLVIIASDLSSTIAAAQKGEVTITNTVIFVGDLTNPQYALTSSISKAAIDGYIQNVTDRSSPLYVTEEALGGSAARTEFENYVPGLLVFAVIMLVFQASMAVAREIESGTLKRLRLTRMKAIDFLGGIGASLVLVGIVSVMLTLATAWALDFRSQGPWWVAILVGAVTSLSIVGVGLMVACFTKTVTQAFLIANFPLALFMFFSGAVYPIPRVSLFEIAGHSIGLYDILPPTHAVVALNKVLTLGEGLGDVAFELGALVLLTVLYFGIGVWLFNRRHLKTA